MTGRQAVPGKIIMILLPCRAPELTPLGNVWRYLRANRLANHVFGTYVELIDATRGKRNRTLGRSGTIRFIGACEWSQVVQP